jgi:hypothetical protein
VTRSLIIMPAARSEIIEAQGSPGPIRVLFRPIYLLFPTRKFHCYSVVPKSPRFGRKPLKLLARPRSTGPKYSKNSLLIPLLPQIALRFQRDGANPKKAGRHAVHGSYRAVSAQSWPSQLHRVPRCHMSQSAAQRRWRFCLRNPPGADFNAPTNNKA